MYKLVTAIGVSWFLAAQPTSVNYILKTYDLNNGAANGSSTNYQLNASTGSQSTTLQTSTNYSNLSGESSGVNTNVPPAPAFSNPNSYYDRLQLIINTGNNPSDTKFLIAISTDNFATTNYVQADNTVGSSQAITNYRTYAAYGSGSGFFIVGLTPSTTYKVKVKALQGNFSGSAFGPDATAATVAPSLTFSVTTTLTATPPFPVSFTSLTPGSVINGNADAVIALSSNALNGGAVYLRGLNNGLLSNISATTITSASGDLAVASSGYGAQVTTASQGSGGPFVATAPFNGTADNVGVINTNLQSLLSTTAPITSGNANVRLKAKASNITPSATDYADTLTFIAAMNF